MLVVHRLQSKYVVAVQNRKPGERRRIDGPFNGMTTPCPQCGTHSIEFNERYRLPNPDGTLSSAPGWVCDNPACDYHGGVRLEDLLEAAPRLRKQAKELRAKARRRVMKSKFVRARANRSLSKSLARRKK